MTPARRAAPLLVPLIWIAIGVGARAADEQASAPPPPPPEISGERLLKDLDIRVWGPWKQTAPQDYVFEGKVTITWRESRIQADRMTLTQGRYVEAEGNVLVVWGGNRISGTRMTYDLVEERGYIENAMGQVENDYIFWAKRAEKVGESTVHVVSATITTCTQPLPYWSFSVSSATITLDRYARMWNVRLRARRMPVIYLPYLVWPVKEGRALGLLMPEFHASDTRGQSVAQQLFIPLGRSADLTLLGEYYTKAGFGWGGEVRFMPNRQGSALLNGFYIDDKVAQRGRYSASYQQTQQFNNGFRMVADIDLVSDFEFFSDYEQDLSLVSSPTILARLEFSRNGRWTSMNVRELRREQLFADETSLVQQTLPEIEWRGRSRRLGRTPLYLSYESSVASIQQRGVQQGQSIDADYLRGDLFPTLSLPFSPVPWLDITPRIGYRVTHYTQSQREIVDATGETVREVSDADLTRQLFGAGLDIVGPKFFRIFSGPGGRKFKHSIEPRVSYGYQESFDESEQILLYDEVDRFSGPGNLVSYGIAQRLFAKRPRAALTLPSLGESIVMPDGSVDAPAGIDRGAEPGPDEAAGAPPGPEEPVEIASFEVRQSRSFDQDLSVADLDEDGVAESTSRASRIQLIGRYNPSRTTTLDLRSNYDILFNAFSDVTLSGGLRRRLAQLRFSLVHRNGLGVVQVGSEPDGMGGTRPLFARREDDTQVRLTAGLTVYHGKLSLMVDGLFDADPVEGQKHVPDKRWRIQYRTQCCAFLLERLSRNYSSIADRQDFYFRVDLSGIGKILDFKY